MASTSLLEAMDSNLYNIDKMSLGENSHPEYSWSQNIQEKFVQFSFQLTENGSQNINLLEQLKIEYINLINSIYSDLSNREYFNLSYKLIAQTRDIISGKGLYTISYMMIAVWANITQFLDINDPSFKLFGEILASKAIEGFVDTSIGHPLGSWKDMKYFCNYLYSIDKNILENPVFLHVIKIINRQLSIDKYSSNPSLLAKWIPREKSKKFGWITKHLAFDFFKSYLTTTNNNDFKYQKAQNKCLTHYRQLISNINKKLNTVQIYQCEKNWKSIDFDKNVTSITLRKQSLAFQDIKKRGAARQHPSIVDKEDRKICADNFKKYIYQCNSGEKVIKSKNVAIYDLIRGADELFDTDPNNIERLALNNQWNNQNKSFKFLQNMIAMVDTSGSMECDGGKPLYTAIGLGLRVAENSIFGKRILTFSNQPQWINLDNCQDFVQSVKTIRRADWGMNTNFYAALDLILDTALKNNVSPDVMKNTNLVIFSDMQIDQAVGQTFGKPPPNLKSIFEEISSKYHDAGMKSSYKKPFSLPHIIFWNLRTTNGFPSLSSTINTSMVSGSSLNLFNSFQDKGATFLQDLTPWTLLRDSLNIQRYENFSKNIEENINLIL